MTKDTNMKGGPGALAAFMDGVRHQLYTNDIAGVLIAITTDDGLSVHQFNISPAELTTITELLSKHNPPKQG